VLNSTVSVYGNVQSGKRPEKSGKDPGKVRKFIFKIAQEPRVPFK